jgi:hypothetical protein
MVDFGWIRTVEWNGLNIDDDDDDDDDCRPALTFSVHIVCATI